jgi:hypothetical protein
MSHPGSLSEITRTVETYFKGLHEGDATHLRSTFDSAAHVVGFYQGALTRQTLEEWIVEIEGLPKPHEKGDPFDMQIVTVDLADTTAFVKTSLLYMGLRFTDVMTLIKFEDGWKVTHKAYSHE